MIETDIYLTLLLCGTVGRGDSLAGIVRESLIDQEGKGTAYDLLCYCHQSKGPVWERPCAKFRAELGLPSLFPLAFGQSGCLSFAHALTMTKWLFEGGPYRSALCVITERMDEESSDDDDRAGNSIVAIVEASVERGAYRVLRGARLEPDLSIATRKTASDPFLELKSQESELAVGSVIALLFQEGTEAQSIILRKQI